LKKGDIALIVIALIFLALWLFPAGSGEYADIYVDGKLYGTLSLDEDTSLLVESEYGKNTVTVKDGEIYIEDATCPDKLCQMSHLDKKGGSIVCLPNRVSIIIEGKKSQKEIDVIV